jgi:hypothetical protein
MNLGNITHCTEHPLQLKGRKILELLSDYQIVYKVIYGTK